MGEADSKAGQLLVTHLLVTHPHSSRSIQHSKTVQFPKQFSNSPLFYFRGPSLTILAFNAYIL